MSLPKTISDRLIHLWHVITDVRPIYWISLYLCLVPVFALFYWLLPAGQFRIPDGGGSGFGDWLYYSIVTLTTLGFGDYTPCGAGSQWITAVEVLCGLVTIGFFLNSVAAMKSEIDVTSEIEKQRRLALIRQRDLLVRNIPVFMHRINEFLSYCYAVTTPLDLRKNRLRFNPEFTVDDMVDMNRQSGLPGDHTSCRAVECLIKSAASLSLFLDSLQSRVDLSLWPVLLDDCFAFVAGFQMLSSTQPVQAPDEELIHFIRHNAEIARRMETELTKISTQTDDDIA